VSGEEASGKGESENVIERALARFTGGQGMVEHAGWKSK